MCDLMSRSVLAIGLVAHTSLHLMWGHSTGCHSKLGGLCSHDVHKRPVDQLNQSGSVHI
jgi:hypothetical protein